MLRPSHPAKVTSLWKTVQDGYVQHKGVGTLWSLGQEEGAWECTYTVGQVSSYPWFSGKHCDIFLTTFPKNKETNDT